MITDAQVEHALQFMWKQSNEYAKAKSERRYLEEYRKSLKSILVNEFPEGTVLTRESYAYSHEKYLAVLEGIRAAVDIEEALRWKMVYAENLCNIYRTQQANNRVMDASAA